MDNTVHKTTIDILRYVLTGKAEKITQDIDFNELYTFSKSHGVENMIYVGLRDMNIGVPEDIMAKFKQAYEIQIMVEATQALELEAIGRAFEEAGIDYIPLKGSVIKYLYPMPDYRKSGDIDILVREKDQKKADKIMKANGYIVDEQDEYELHKGYRKPPFILVEIHDRLVEKNNRAYDALSKVWEYAELKKGTDHHYIIDDEFLYAFTVAHLCKHIKNGGAGIKFILDIYILQRNKKQSQKEKLYSIIKSANLSEFDLIVNEIVGKWFYDNTSISTKASVLEQFIFNGGSFGTVEQKKLLNDSKAFESKLGIKGYKAEQIINGIFSNVRDMKKKYEFVRKYPVLLPAAWFVRWISLITKDRYKIKYKLTVDTSSSKELSELWKIIK